jgi:hypothetical protein
MKKAVILSAIALLGCNQAAKQQAKTVTAQQEEILKIEYVRYEGDMGWGESIIITKDSIFYSETVAATGSKIEYKNQTSEILWNKLLTVCNLEAFEKIPSGESNLPSDGTDETFSIVTNKRTLSFTNGYGKEYKALANFIDIVKEQVLYVVKKKIISQ